MKLIRGFYMTFELYLLSFGLVALCALFVGLFLDAFYRCRYVKALALKGVASLAFLGLGAIPFCFCAIMSFVKRLILYESIKENAP